MIVFGGWTAVERSNRVSSLDIDTWQWKDYRLVGRLPSGRYEHASAYANRTVWIYGGIDIVTGSRVDDIRSLNLESNRTVIVRSVSTSIGVSTLAPVSLSSTSRLNSTSTIESVSSEDPSADLNTQSSNPSVVTSTWKSSDIAVYTTSSRRTSTSARRSSQVRTTFLTKKTQLEASVEPTTLIDSLTGNWLLVFSLGGILLLVLIVFGLVFCRVYRQKAKSPSETRADSQFDQNQTYHATSTSTSTVTTTMGSKSNMKSTNMTSTATYVTTEFGILNFISIAFIGRTFITRFS